MHKLLKALLLTIPLLTVSSHSYAVGCGELAQNTEVVTSIDAECTEQILGFKATIDNVNKLFQANSSPSGIDVVTGKAQVSSEASDSSIFMIHGIGILALVVAIVIVTIFAVGVFTHTFRARNERDTGNAYANGALVANLIKMFSKAPLAVSWSIAVVFCFLASLSLCALLIYNIMVQNHKETQLTYASYASDSKDKADKRAADDINAWYKYSSCVIDHDKRLLFDNSVKSDYTFEKSNYQSCMAGKSSKLDEPKTTFIFRHLYRVQDCGAKYANLSNATCGFVNFKIDAQQVLKEKFISFENRMLIAVNDLRSYYCLNQVVVDKDSDLKNSCWEFNPVTYEIPLDDKGRIKYVTTSKSYAEIKQTMEGLKAEYSAALQATALENFKNYVPVPVKFTAVDYIKSKFTENKLRRAVKNYNTQAMDFEFKYVDEFQYSKVRTNFSTSNNMVNGGTSKSSVFNEQINTLIDSLTKKSQEQVIKDMVYASANFMGRGYVENLGLKYEAGGEYNILSATITAGQETATYLIMTSIALRGVEAGLSMVGTRNMSGKPDMSTIMREKVFGFFAGYTKAFGLAIAGAVIGLVLLIVFTIVSQVITLCQNVVKIAYLYELSFIMAGVDDQAGMRFNFNDIIRRLITLLYVLLGFVALIIEFELMFQVMYLLTDFAKDNFYLINKSAGYVVDSGNTVMSVVYDMAVMFAFHVVVISSMMMGMRTVNQAFHAALLQKLFGSQDMQSSLLMQDQNKMIRNTEGHFGSMAKNARAQRI